MSWFAAVLVPSINSPGSIVPDAVVACRLCAAIVGRAVALARLYTTAASLPPQAGEIAALNHPHVATQYDVGPNYS